MSAKDLIAVALMVALVGCGPRSQQTPQRPTVRGLVADPARLPFTCVTPGCDVTVSVAVRVQGDRRVAVKRIILEGDARQEFSVAPSQTPPFIVGSNEEGFGIDIRYAPKGAPASAPVNLAITYTDSSPVESEDRIPPGELLVPLVRRLVGEPIIDVRPTSLSFGVVAPGQTRTVPVVVTNLGFGNVALEIRSVDAGHPAFRAQLPALNALVADAGTEVPVTFAPSTEEYATSHMLITPTSGELEPVAVAVEGTSLSTPHLAGEPSLNLDFGDVAKRQARALTATLLNQGGRDLVLSNVVLTDSSGNLKVKLAGGQSTVTLGPLQRAPLSVSLDAGVAGPIDATVAMDTNEPGAPVVQLHITGTVTEPRLRVSPTSLEWGTVPQGWVMAKPLEVRNVGFGALTIKKIILVPGTSDLFSLRSRPPLPVDLHAGQRVTLDVEFRAEATASFQGSVSVESTDPETPFAEVSLSAAGGSCTASCPIANGTPSCRGGSCTVGSCNAGWYDVDAQAANGCECHEPGSDPGSFCAESLSKGTFRDVDRRRETYTGLVPASGDIDIIKLHGEDVNQVFSDDYDVRIRLDSGDPDIQMCVFRHPTSTAVNECYFENESCGRTYRHLGVVLGADDADYLIKVFRPTGSASTCTTYTVFIQNG